MAFDAVWSSCFSALPPTFPRSERAWAICAPLISVKLALVAKRYSGLIGSWRVVVSARRREVGGALAIVAAEPERGSGTTLTTKVGPLQTYRYEPPWEPRSWRVAAGRLLLAVAVESRDQFDHCVKRGL